MNELVKILAASNPEALLLNEFDSCVVAIGDRAGSKPVAVYSVEAIIKTLIRRGCSPLEAEEYFSFNLSSSFVGENAPIFIRFIPGQPANESARSTTGTDTDGVAKTLSAQLP